MVGLMKWLLSVDQASYSPKHFDVARDGDGPLLIEAIYLLGFLEKLREQWMIEVQHWHHESLLLFSFLTHFNGQAPFRNPLLLSLPMMMPELEALQALDFSTTHGCKSPKKTQTWRLFPQKIHQETETGV